MNINGQNLRTALAVTAWVVCVAGSINGCTFCAALLATYVASRIASRLAQGCAPLPDSELMVSPSKRQYLL